MNTAKVQRPTTIETREQEEEAEDLAHRLTLGQMVDLMRLVQEPDGPMFLEEGILLWMSFHPSHPVAKGSAASAALLPTRLLREVAERRQLMDWGLIEQDVDASLQLTLLGRRVHEMLELLLNVTAMDS